LSITIPSKTSTGKPVKGIEQRKS